jgi:hypothetical protein
MSALILGILSFQPWGKQDQEVGPAYVKEVAVDNALSTFDYHTSEGAVPIPYFDYHGRPKSKEA